MHLTKNEVLVSIAILIQGVVILFVYIYLFKLMHLKEKKDNERLIRRDFYNSEHDFSELDEILNLT